MVMASPSTGSRLPPYRRTQGTKTIRGCGLFEALKGAGQRDAIAGLALLAFGPALDLADPMLGVLGEGGEHGIKGRLLGGFGAAVGLQILEHVAVVGVALHLFPAMPPEIADEEELDPGEQAVGPILQVIAEVDTGSAEIEVRAPESRGSACHAILAGGDLDDPAVEKRMLGAFEEDKAHAVGTGIKPARIEQLEVEAAEPRVPDRDQGSGLRLWVLDEGEACCARACDQSLGIGADKARDEDRARALLIDALDIGAGTQSLAAVLVQHVQDARPLGLPHAEILVAAGREAMQMAEQPVAGARILAVAFPDNGNGGHGL